jgi:pimeloyl-ACP methyl ester carboxylesterase
MRLETSHGTIALEERGSGDSAVIFIHGNSASKEIFAAQLQSPLGNHHRLIAIDLPGHGDSEDARDPQRTYTVAGYADVVREILGRLEIGSYIVVGWSLGGHIAIELAAAEPRPLGIVITGTPPFAKSLESIGEAFRPTSLMELTGKLVFTDEEALAYARATTTLEVDTSDPRYRATRRTDGRARARMIEAVGQGLGVDQRRTVEEVAIPLAIINGQEDAFLNHAYFDKPRYANLWRGAVQRIAGCGHAPFFEKPELYNHLLESFCADLRKSAATDSQK